MVQIARSVCAFTKFVMLSMAAFQCMPVLKGVRLQKYFPPSIIDVEASGFGSKSYPIEIGVVRYDGAKWCKLIRPLDNWIHWDKNAEKLHGISREMLIAHGESSIKVCHELNAFLSNTIVYSDGWVVDSSWLIKLFSEASVPMSFSCRAIEYLLSESQMEHWHDVKTQIENSSGEKRHRASTDAMVIQRTFMQTLAMEA